MTLTDWLEEEVGRSQALAAHTARTASAISQWKTNGVPLEWMQAVRDFTGGAVSLEEMVIDAAKRREGRQAASNAPA